MAEIPYSIDSVNPNEVYKIEINNVYDPSKFWVILHNKERTLFQKYLNDFYKENKMLMGRYHIKKYTSCIVCQHYNYYRAVIMPVLLPDKDKLRVFLVDFGQMVNVKAVEIFYIFKKHCNVPRFAIRSTLANITPLDQNEAWTLTDFQKFIEIITDKELYARIQEIDEVQKILYLDLHVIQNDSSILCINSLLIESGFGAYSELLEKSNDKISKYKTKIKYMHLIPTFNAIEKGVVPCSLWEHTLLKDVPLDLLYKPYYEFQNINSNIHKALIKDV